MLRTRITTAAVLIALLLIVLWLPPIATIIALTAVVLAGAWEWSAFLGNPTPVMRWTHVLAVAAVLPLVW